MIPRRFLIFVALLLLVTISVLALVPPFPQPQSYHAFADQRVLWGIPHVGDVLTNLAFLVAGLGGLQVLHRHRRELQDAQIWLLPYWLFAAGLCMVAIGSAYYHVAPSDDRLFWDRLPMSIAFMALLAAFIADRIDPRIGKLSLVPLLILGAATVLYWRTTDDLRPYLLMQGTLIASLVAVSAMFPPGKSLRGGNFIALAGFYILAVVCEQRDTQLWELLGHTISGHNIKHVAAAAAAGAVVVHLRDEAVKRRAAAS